MTDHPKRKLTYNFRRPQELARHYLRKTHPAIVGATRMMRSNKGKDRLTQEQLNRFNHAYKILIDLEYELLHDTTNYLDRIRT
jgi:hypothetical protein